MGRPAGRVLALALASFIAIGARSACGDGLRRVDAAWLVPSDIASVAVGACSAAPGSGAWARAGQMRLFGLAALPSRSLACGWRGAWAAEVSWEALGTTVFRDDRAVGRFETGRTWRWGAQAGWRRVRPGQGGSLGQADLALLFGVRRPLGGGWNAVVRLQVPVAAAGTSKLGIEPAQRALIGLGAPGCAVAMAIDEGADGRPRGSWELLWGLGEGLGVSCRGDGSGGALGGGLTWQRGGLRLRTSHLVHPDLGLTHRVELACGAPGVSPW